MNIKSLTVSKDYSKHHRRFLRDTRCLHWITILTVYGITGTLVTLLSRLILNGALQMEGGLITGPWAYRGVYLLVIPPLYSVMLIAVGTVFGRHLYFRRRVFKMWSRLLPTNRIAKFGP